MSDFSRCIVKGEVVSHFKLIDELSSKQATEYILYALSKNLVYFIIFIIANHGLLGVYECSGDASFISVNNKLNALRHPIHAAKNPLSTIAGKWDKTVFG